jgi:hypothetical protein
MKHIFRLVILTTLIGCSQNSIKTDQNSNTSNKHTFPIKPLIIDNGEESEGWGADIRLSLIEIISTQSSTIYKAVSSYKGKNIGFEINIPKNISESEKGGPQILTIKSNGEVSDNLLDALSDLYKQKSNKRRKFAKVVLTDFIDLNEFSEKTFGKEAVTKTKTKELKVFFTTKNPDNSSELYLNINDTENWIEIKEKDSEYRPLIINFLTQKQISV